MSETGDFDHDLAVIGAGPAGMAAARSAAGTGARVLVLDEQSGAGGQIYRGIDANQSGRAYLGPGYFAGNQLVSGLDHANIRHLAGATVWRIGADREIAFSIDGVSRVIRADRIVLAAGALERPSPFPGWTLPGVMTAGAAQIMLKTSGLVPRDAVLAGCGPLLYLAAAQLIDAGAPPSAIVETGNRGARIKSFRHGTGAVRGWRLLVKGLGLLATIRKAGVPRYRGASNFEAAAGGPDGGLRFGFACRGQNHVLECTSLLVHQGVVPNVQLSRALGAAHDWDPAQRAWRPRLDQWGGTGIEGIAVAGDGGGIVGAGASELQGRIAGLEAGRALGLIGRTERDRRARPFQRALRHAMAIRPFLDALYAPSHQMLVPPDETIICRCEGTRAGDIRQFSALGAAGPNQIKAFGRCGMGACQGRFCGLTAAEIQAAELGVTPKEIGYFRVRSPVKPVTLGELSALAD